MENIPDRFLGSNPPVRAELLMQSGEEEISREAHDFKVVGSNPASAISAEGAV